MCLTVCSVFEVASSRRQEFADTFNCSRSAYCILCAEFLTITVIFSTVLSKGRPIER